MNDKAFYLEYGPRVEKMKRKKAKKERKEEEKQLKKEDILVPWAVECLCDDIYRILDDVFEDEELSLNKYCKEYEMKSIYKKVNLRELTIKLNRAIEDSFDKHCIDPG